MFKILICSLLSIFVLISCNVSFPTETLEKDAVDLIKKDMMNMNVNNISTFSGFSKNKNFLGKLI